MREVGRERVRAKEGVGKIWCVLLIYIQVAVAEKRSNSSGATDTLLPRAPTSHTRASARRETIGDAEERVRVGEGEEGDHVPRAVWGGRGKTE